MALTDAQILSQNPWWTDPDWKDRDPHLLLLGRHPRLLPTDLVTSFDLEHPGIHVLRGPRQVGKTTDLKLLVQRAIGSHAQPRSVLYLALDLIEGEPHAQLASSLLRAKALAGHPGPSLVLLDEITSVARWQTAIKALWDDGTLREDVVVCTGSSAVDLRRSATERLPGRRGGGRDHLVLPQSFASFARCLDGSIPASPGLDIAQMLDQSARAVLEDGQIHAPALQSALERYMSFGGLPAAVAEAASGSAEPSPETKRVLRDSLIREVQRMGASAVATDALLERVLRSLGSRTNWSKLAREMDLPLGRARAGTTHVTMRNYVETLAAGYFLLIAYFWRTDSQTNSLSNDKKLFFVDPLLHTIALDRAPGLSANVPALVENLVGTALLRRYEAAEHLVETFDSPARLHIWQTAKGGEIDFVAGTRRSLDVVEVKYQRNIDMRGIAGIARALPGRPAVIATRDQLRFRESHALIPAHLLLWALG
jgi:predicted AAA+ superfamily ATPase